MFGRMLDMPCLYTYKIQKYTNIKEVWKLQEMRKYTERHMKLFYGFRRLAIE